MKRWYGILALAFLVASPAWAQTPTVGVYFDAAGTQNTATLNGGYDEAHTAYVIAFAEMLVGGAAFKLDVDPRIAILAAVYPAGVQIGSLLDGIEIGFTNPVVGYFGQPVVLATMTLYTNGYLIAYGRLNVVPYAPRYESVMIADGDGVLTPAVGLCSWLTIPVGTEQDSWGQVKVLYQ